MRVLERAIPEGYKRTELGDIPIDWDTKELAEVCSLKSGLGITAKDINNSNAYPCYGGNGLRGYTKSFTHEGDFALIGRQGALCGNIQYATGKFFASEHALVASPNKDVNAKWLAIYLERMNLNQYSESSAQPGLSAEKLRVLKLITPLPKEQTAIANALSDVDALLTELEKLIAKKQAIKTASMQQLLTGKTRLPQFATYTEGEKQGQPKGTKTSELGEIPEDWDVLPAREAIEFFGGYGFSSRLSSDSGVKWLKIANVGLNEVKWDANSFLPEKLLTNFKAYSLKESDVVMALTRPLLSDKLKIAKITSSDLPALLNQRVAKLIPKRSNCLEYIFYVVQRAEFIAQMNLAMAGTDPPNIGTTALGNINIVMSPAEEQTTIATILSDMDNEIQTLEQRLAKTRQIKQGMMQELLTGRTRLPFDKNKEA